MVAKKNICLPRFTAAAALCAYFPLQSRSDSAFEAGGLVKLDQNAKRTHELVPKSHHSRGNVFL